jgi:hypothetical protein
LMRVTLMLVNKHLQKQTLGKSRNKHRDGIKL